MVGDRGDKVLIKEDNVILDKEDPSNPNTRHFRIIKLISKLKLVIKSAIIIAMIFFIINKIGNFILYLSVEPSTEYVRQTTVGEIISITYDSKYEIEYKKTENNMTTIDKEIISVNNNIIDESIEKPVLVKYYYKKFMIFKVSKTYLKMSMDDYNLIKKQKNITY